MTIYPRLNDVQKAARKAKAKELYERTGSLAKVGKTFGVSAVAVYYWLYPYKKEQQRANERIALERRRKEYEEERQRQIHNQERNSERAS